MASQDVTIRMRVLSDFSDAKGDINQLSQYLSKLKMPANTSASFEKTFDKMKSDYTQLQALMNKGIKTKSDLTTFERLTSSIQKAQTEVKELFGELSSKHLKLNVNMDIPEIKQAKANIEELKRQLHEKISTQTFSQVEQQIKNLSSIAKTNPVKDLKTAFETLNLSKAQTELNNVVTSMSRMSGAKEGIEAVRKFQQAFSQGDMEAEELSNTINSLPTDRLKQVATYCVEVAKNLKSIDSTEIERIQTESVEAQKALQQLENTQMSKATSEMKQYDTAIDNVSQSANELLQRQKQIGQDSMNMTSKISELKSYAEQFFSVTSTVMLARRALQQTLETVKELDKAMSETAVVTDFSIGDMWNALPKYTQAANELGATTLGAYQTMTLFYQQGLDTNEVFEIGTETMKMARIAGLEYADATNLMTAALRGFNMELNEASATRINDVYSELAAITAADTNEIATAMTKTASIASNANMEFETTAALLSQIIETTREPAETAGTAMKTIIARFTEMKKSASEIVNVEGEEINVNKVEAALRDAGVALRDVNGEFRDLDDVFLELSSKWNGLDKMTQRYVATMAAGSRQQSRFIAMMQDYDRTMELVNAAYNSEGSSETQFGKTQESLESKINKLTNAWNEFLMGITNSSVIKAGIDLLTGLLNVVNDITDIFGEGAGGVLKFATAIGTLFAASKLSNKALIKISDYMTSIKEMNQVRRTGTLLNGAQASAEQRAAAMSGNRKFFSASAQKPSRWQRIINKANQKSETEQAVINATRQRQVSEAITQKQSQIDGWRQSQSSMYAGGRLTPELDAKFTKDIEKANAEVRVLQGQLKALQSPTQLNIMTDEARAKVAMLEKELDARPMDTELKLQLDEARLQLEAFEQLQEMDGINVPLDVNTTKGDVEVAAAKERWDNPVPVPLVPTEGSGTLKNGPIDRIKARFQEIKQQIKDLPPKVKMALAVVAAAATAVVATVAAVYATWYNSGLQVSKRLAEAQAGTLENTRAQTEALTTEIQELEEAWTRIQDGEDYLKGLIEGTVEWTQKIQELNSEVQALTEKYSDLYDYITIDKSSGQWVLSEEGYQTYLNLEQDKLTESTNRQLFQQALSNYSTALYEAGDAAAAKDYLWNWQLQQNSVERRYAATLQKAFKMANEGQTKIGGTDEVDKLDSEILNDILSDTKTRKYIEELDDDETWLNFSGLASFGTIGTDFLINGRNSLLAHADPRAALEYYDELQKAEQLVKTEEDAYVRNYLASSGLYGATTQEAVANVMYQKEGAYKALERDQENRSTWWALRDYDGKTGGAGARMRGEANDQGESVEAIMESLGYELIDSSKNHYKHKTTDQLVNVDAVGGGAADEKTKDVDGEQMQVWSNEYVRELGRQEAIRKGIEKEIDALANEFSENEELAKMVAGDLSANLDELADDYSNEFFDVKTLKEKFEKSRQEQMKELADSYGIEFSSKSYGYYSQQAYEIAEATKQFEKSVESMGETTAQNLTTIYLLLSQEEGGFQFSTEEDVSHIKEMSNYLNEAGVSASNLQDFVGKIDTSSAINGARQLNKYLEEGGKNAALSTMVKTLDETGENLFSLENQFKEMFSNEQWIEETQSALTEIYKLEGKITADNIRELTEKNSDLATVLEVNSLKASGFAKMMEAVEEGSLSLGQVTTDLIKIYDQLYYSVDLAGEAIARLESVEIGDSDTKIGNIYSESFAAVKDLIERGAYGDSQIDDYMNQMIGEIAWNEALSTAEGNKVKAYTAIDKEYGLSKNQGNLYGSWSTLIKNSENKNSLADGAITIDANGIVNYDLSDVKNTQELVDKIVKETGVVKEYAETMVADMKTYSKTFGADLEDLDKRGTLDSFLDSRVTKDGTLIASDVELSAFSKAYGQSLEEFKANLLDNVEYESTPGKTQKINKIEDRKYSETGSYYIATDKTGNKKFSLTNEEFTNSQIQSQMDAYLDGQDWSKDVHLNLTDPEGNDLTADYVTSLLGVDAIRDIVLDPEMPEDEKMQHIKTMLQGHFDDATTNGLIDGFTNDQAASEAEAMAANTGDDVYNKIGGALYEACQVLKENPVTIPITFSGLSLKMPSNRLTELLKLPSEIKLFQDKKADFTIGGDGTGMNQGGGFKPRTSSSSSPPITDLLGDVDSSGVEGNTEGGKGSAYNEGHDEDNTGKDSGGGGGGSEEENDTNPKVENLNTKLEALDRKLERREIDAVEHQFAQDALYLEKKMALQVQKNAAESEAKYIGKYYKYDAETDAYLYLENAYNNASDETKNKIDEEIDKLQSINDELNEIEDAIEDFEFKNPFDEERFYEAEGDKINSDNELAHIDRQRKENERYKELVGKMPSEVQGPLNLALTGADMFYESQEISANLNRKAALEQQMQAKYNDSEFYGKYYTWNERTQSFDINSEALSNPDLKPKTRDAIMEEFEEMQGFAKEWRDVSDELSGGFIQDAFKEAGEAAEDLAISFINDGHAADNINDIFNRFEKKLGLNEKALDGFGNAIGDAIDSSELLDKTFKGFGIENIEEKINKSPIGGLLSGNQKALLSMIGGEGGTIGELGSSIGLNISEALGGFGQLLNFDMMSLGLDMFNGFQDMIDQGKQMIEKIVGYITQATQVIVDAWTNREDYLYNFLQIIEKHLNEYEKLQRYQNQLEKGRTSTVDEIRANYDKQWKSLQQQLEEQQERLETRQEELNRSRWNPFSLISGWDPSSDALYENRSVKFAWDLIIGFGEAFAPFGTGAFFSQLNQLYEDYDQRVQNSYEDRLAAEQALLDIEDERLELVKYGSDEATEFEQKVLDAMIKKEQEQIDELARLNDAITDANSKLISTLQDNLDKMRQDRENEKKEEELGEKERRLAYLRQDTSGANMMEIKKLEEELEEGHEDYTDTLIDQKISELEKQNELAAEQRQQQIDLLQSQLDYAEKYGLYWDAIYGMLYTIDENGNAVLNPENFDLDGNIRENSQLAQMLGTFSDRLGMSVWSAVLDNEEMKRLGRYYGFFIGNNGVTGNWRHQWALDNPGADDPNFAYPDQEIPEGLWGVLYRLEIFLRERSINNNPDLWNRAGRTEQAFKNFFGKLFGNEEWANYKHEAVNAAHVQSTTFAGMKKLSDDTKEWFKSLFSNNESYGNKTSRNLTGNGAQNIGDINTTNYFQIGNVGETVSLDDMVDRVAEKFRDMFSIGNNVLGRNRT